MQTVVKPYPIEGYTLAEYTSGGWALKHGSETVFRSADKDGYAAMCAILTEAKRAKQEAKARRHAVLVADHARACTPSPSYEQWAAS